MRRICPRQLHLLSDYGRKYEQSAEFGVVASASSNAIWTVDSSEGLTAHKTGAGIATVGANEEVLCWDIKKGELLSRWRDNGCAAIVTIIARSITNSDVFAVGYSDGSIRVWDSKIATIIINFNGHRSAITTLAFDEQGTQLASGSRDTDIIVWDLIAETGLFKLRGHKDQITGLHFLHPSAQQTDGQDEGTPSNGIPKEKSGTVYLLSTSKDATIKLWDVTAQYCIETHITQSNGECWALAVSPDDSGCVTGGNDAELKFWSLDIQGLSNCATRLEQNTNRGFVIDRGILRRQGRDRTTGISFHPRADYLVAHGSEKAVELWRIRSIEEIQKSLARKRKRKREKASDEKGDQPDTEMVDAENEASSTAGLDVKEVFVPYVIVRTGGKLRCVDWAGGRSSEALQLLIATTDNQLEVYNVPVRKKVKKMKNEEPPEYNRTFSVELPGHRADIRAISLSSDDRLLATASNGSLKIWNVRTHSCLRTLACGYALCCSFLPGDKIVISGNKNGELELFDIASATLIDTIQAHQGSVWTLKVHPDGRSVVTGSADKTAKFWSFEVVQEDIPGTKRTISKLKLTHTRTLKVNDDVLNLCFSPDSRLLAVATLDNTVKVFFVDSLKLFLNLYGHKLPVLNISISSDSKLIATCSADKNVRLWGLDFGDCHRAFFAHDESIMQVAFIAHPLSREDGHVFFSASKDHLLKTWDGDKFGHIQKLSGHHGEIWAMVVSRTGDFVISASHDKSIRVWSRTDEPLFLDEERERELEAMYDENLTNSLGRNQRDEDLAADGVEGGAQVVPASKQTATTLTAGEKITEALTLCTEDLQVIREHEVEKLLNTTTNHAAPQRHPLLTMRNVPAEKHLLSVFEAIPSSALHDALLLLSFSILPSLFVFLSIWLEKEMNVPLTCRVLFFLLKTHHKQIIASRELKTQLQEMRVRLRGCLQQWKSLMGFNMAATKILGSRIGEQKIRTIEEEEVGMKGTGGKKRAFVTVG